MQKIKTIFSFQDMEINIIRKKIKHLRMTVSPPNGEVKISAPLAVSDYTIRDFIITQFSWIKKHQSKYLKRIMPAKINYGSGEWHYFLGNAYQLTVIEIQSKAYKKVTLADKLIIIFVKPNTSLDKREKLLYEWYRSEINKIIPQLIRKWEPIIGKTVLEWRTKKMKTRWGSCNIKAKRIWLNLELAKKPPECIEYVLVHEMVHLLERYHNKTFYQYMDQFLPPWKNYRKLLNQN
jgi:predicted metal-dependent hydrolase